MREETGLRRLTWPQVVPMEVAQAPLKSSEMRHTPGRWPSRHQAPHGPPQLSPGLYVPSGPFHPFYKKPQAQRG